MLLSIEEQDSNIDRLFNGHLSCTHVVSLILVLTHCRIIIAVVIVAVSLIVSSAILVGMSIIKKRIRVEAIARTR